MAARVIAWIIMLLMFTVPAGAGDRQVRLLTLEWEPYTGSQMAYKGFVSNAVAQAYQKAGYEVSIVFKPWEEALSMAIDGKVDGVFPAYHAREREKVFLYSDEICQSTLGLCKRRRMIQPSPGGGVMARGYAISFHTDPRIDEVQALRDLKAYTFGVVSGYANTPAFDAADFLIKRYAPNDEANIAQLLGDDVQLIVIDKYVARNIMVKKFPWFSGEVAFMQPPLSRKGLFLVISRKAESAEKKIQAFNAGLRILKQDGVMAALMRRYGF